MENYIYKMVETAEALNSLCLIVLDECFESLLQKSGASENIESVKKLQSDLEDFLKDFNY